MSLLYYFTKSTVFLGTYFYPRGDAPVVRRLRAALSLRQMKQLQQHQEPHRAVYWTFSSSSRRVPLSRCSTYYPSNQLRVSSSSFYITSPRLFYLSNSPQIVKNGQFSVVHVSNPWNFVITPFVIRYFTSRSLPLPYSPASRTLG